MKLMPLLLLAALCGGCETVVFEAPPVAAQACDPQLVGTWFSVGGKPGDRGEVELRIAQDCELWFVEHERGGIDAGTPTTLHVGLDSRIGYAWVNARWVETRMRDHPDHVDLDGDSAIAAEDILLLQYRVSGRRLEFRMADAKAFAHRVIDERIKGTVQADEGEIAVRITAPVDPKQLRESRLFPRGEMRFERATPNE